MIHIQTSSGEWDQFCRQIMDFLKADIIDLTIEGKHVRGYRSPDSPSLWIRDHSDMVRGGKYVEPDILSSVSCFADMQSVDGRIFDFVSTFPEKSEVQSENWEKWVRVPVEADVEYRFVKAAYLAWQATGNTEWIALLIPSLDRAITYSMTHPWRWDEEHQLMKRAYTIDTWDFDYTAGRSKWLNFQITDDTYWGIFHGDNSGLYEAAILLTKLYSVVGQINKAEKWEEIATGIQNRANKLLFNGRFYTHFYKLSPVKIKGIDESEQLSLSTPMAINRGLATHELAVSILNEYWQRGQKTQAFAEWFGIDPPFPDGIFGDEKLVGGAYINGGIFPLAGGELAKAALDHGFEQYGFQQLEKYRKMIAESGETYLWYFPDGTPSSEETSTSPEAMSTDGWGSSAMLFGFIEGICGIQDMEHSFKTVRCAPRWLVAGEDTAKVNVSYAASGRSFGYDYVHYPNDHKFKLVFESEKVTVHLHQLLPEECTGTALVFNGERRDFQPNMVEKSAYIDAQFKVDNKAEVDIYYEKT